MSKLALLGGKPAFGAKVETYPRPLGNELDELRKVLENGRWNLGYGPGPTEQLEEWQHDAVAERTQQPVKESHLSRHLAIVAVKHPDQPVPNRPSPGPGPAARSPTHA